MKTILSLIALLLISFITLAQTFVSGSQSGTWTKANSPYIVVGNVSTSSLTIEAGVEILFKPGFYLATSGGTFTISGTANNPVIFKPYEGTTPGSWEGIIVREPGNINLDHFVVKNAVNGITIRAYGNRRHPAVNVSNADISYCSQNGVRVYVTTGIWNTLARPYLRLYDSKIHHNLGNGCWLDDLANPKCAAYARLDIFGSSIYQNGANGVYADPGCYVNAYTSTFFSNNANGLRLRTTSSVHNCIVAENAEYGFSCAGSLSGPDHVTYSCFSNNGSGEFFNVTGTNFAQNIQVNRNGDSTDIAFNLYTNPMFLDTLSGDFTIDPNSPCVNAGTEVYNAGTHFDPDGSYPEIGSYYLPSALSVSESSVDFSAVLVNSSAEKLVSIFNPRPDIMQINNITISGDAVFHHSETTPITINPKESFELPISFSPTSNQAYNATLVIGNVEDSLFVSLSGYGFVDSTQIIKVEIPEINAYPLDTLVVPVDVNFPAGTNFKSAEVDVIGWEKDFNFLSIDTSNSLAGDAFWTWVSNVDGSLRFSAAGIDSITGSGTLFYAKFLVPADIKEKHVTLTSSALFNTNSTPVLYTPGVVNIVSTIVYGDVDRNAKVQAYDASLILQYVANLISLDKGQILNASVSSDNTVSALDASLVLMYTVGDINELPSNTYGAEFTSIGVAGMQALIDNSDILIPVSVKAGENIYSFESTVTYDRKVLKFEGVTNSNFVVATNSDFQNKVAVVGARNNITNTNEELFVLRFSVRDAGSLTGSKVSLASLRLNEENVTTNISQVEFTTNGIAIAPGNNLNLGNYPNPFSESTTIQYMLNSPSFVRLTVFNHLGQVLNVLTNKNQPAGMHSFEWFAEDLPAGMYFYKLEVNNTIYCKKMLLIKNNSF